MCSALRKCVFVCVRVCVWLYLEPNPWCVAFEWYCCWICYSTKRKRNKEYKQCFHYACRCGCGSWRTVRFIGMCVSVLYALPCPSRMCEWTYARYVAVSAQNNLLSVCRSKTWRSSRQWKTIRVITWNSLFLCVALSSSAHSPLTSPVPFSLYRSVHIECVYLLFHHVKAYRIRVYMSFIYLFSCVFYWARATRKERNKHLNWMKPKCVWCENWRAKAYSCFASLAMGTGFGCHIYVTH